MKRFTDLKIIERGGSLAGAYCAMLFADRGAQVTVVGETTLDDAQRAYLQPNKANAATFDPAAADVIIESSAPDPLEPAHRPEDHPDTVLVRISPFGSEGPRARWRGSDLTDYALGGHLYLYGDPEREPLRGPANQPAYASGLFAYIGAMTALLAKRRIGRGQIVDVSHVQAMVALHQFTMLRYLMTGDVLRRMGNRFCGQGQPNGLYRCADGWIAIAAPADHQVEALLAVSGLEHLLDLPEITSPMDFQSHPRILDDALAPWLADQTMAEATELLQAMRVPASPAVTMTGLLDDPHLAARDIWHQRHGFTVPRSPLRFGHHQPAAGRRWDGVIPDADNGPLAGLRVLDLTRVWAGPLCTRTLSDLGAEVLWIEAPWSRGPRRLPQSLIEATRYFPNDEQGEQPWNRNAHFIKFALGKRSLTLDLNRPEGREVLADLVPHYDVLIENYSPRVMPNLGFDEDRLHGLNPDLVYMTMPGYGRSGPAENWLAFGSSVDSHAGLSSLIGYRDPHAGADGGAGDPWKGGVAWPDPVAGLHATCAILTALWEREAEPTRGGVTVELAQIEAAVAVVGDRLVEAQVTGDRPAPGNRDDRHLAQGVYPCAGDDRWIAITLVDEDAWLALATLGGLDPNLGLGPPSDRDPAGRNADVLDRAIAEWTTGHDQLELMERLQAAGVVAGAVLDAPGMLADPHLQARNTFVTVDQPQVGPFTAAATPIALSETPAAVRRPAPMLGQHNDEVLLADLALDDGARGRLRDAGVISDGPPE